jgi:hypothetical protein
MIRKVKKNFEYSKRIAIYDFSQTFDKKFLCLSLNKTESQVFREFEIFLLRQYGIKIEPIQEDLDFKSFTLII